MASTTAATRRRGARRAGRPALLPRAHEPRTPSHGRDAARSGVAPACRAGGSSPRRRSSCSACRSSPRSGRSSCRSRSGTASSAPTLVGLGNYQQMVTDADAARRRRAHGRLHRCCSCRRRCWLGLVARVALNRRIGLHRLLPDGDLRAVRRLGGGDRHPDHLPVQPAVRPRRTTCLRALGLPQQGWLEDPNAGDGRHHAHVAVGTGRLHHRHLPGGAAGHPRASCSRRPASTAPTGGSRSGTSRCPQLAPVTVFVDRLADHRRDPAVRPRLHDHPRRPARRDPDDRLLPVGDGVQDASSSATARRSPTCCSRSRCSSRSASSCTPGARRWRRSDGGPDALPHAGRPTRPTTSGSLVATGGASGGGTCCSRRSRCSSCCRSCRCSSRR